MEPTHGAGGSWGGRVVGAAIATTLSVACTLALVAGTPNSERAEKTYRERVVENDREAGIVSGQVPPSTGMPPLLQVFSQRGRQLTVPVVFAQRADMFSVLVAIAAVFLLSATVMIRTPGTRSVFALAACGFACASYADLHHLWVVFGDRGGAILWGHLISWTIAVVAIVFLLLAVLHALHAQAGFLAPLPRTSAQWVRFLLRLTVFVIPISLCYLSGVAAVREGTAFFGGPDPNAFILFLIPTGAGMTQGFAATLFLLKALELASTAQKAHAPAQAS